ncbi:hypothetical protein HDU76_012493 [Blyttiomyces sp. JEL0837]|nr:hypothetical protein HDU76_012493 [Blyttiomyces sp. JEL0837]
MITRTSHLIILSLVMITSLLATYAVAAPTNVQRVLHQKAKMDANGNVMLDEAPYNNNFSPASPPGPSTPITNSTGPDMIIGALLGFTFSSALLMTGLGASMDVNGHTVFTVIVTASGAAAIFFMEHLVTILGTANTGAMAILLGMDLFARTGFAEAINRTWDGPLPRANQITGPSWGFLAAGAVLGMAGWFVQTRPGPPPQPSPWNPAYWLFGAAMPPPLPAVWFKMPAGRAAEPPAPPPPPPFSIMNYINPWGWKCRLSLLLYLLIFFGGVKLTDESREMNGKFWGSIQDYFQISQALPKINLVYMENTTTSTSLPTLQVSVSCLTERCTRPKSSPKGKIRKHSFTTSLALGQSRAQNTYSVDSSVTTDLSLALAALELDIKPPKEYRTGGETTKEENNNPQPNESNSSERDSKNNGDNGSESIPGAMIPEGNLNLDIYKDYNYCTFSDYDDSDEDNGLTDHEEAVLFIQERAFAICKGIKEGRLYCPEDHESFYRKYASFLTDEERKFLGI